MTTTDDIPDTIERSIRIDASAETVWRLVSEPGWWINEGTVVAHEIRDAGDHVVVIDPSYGEFRIRVLEEDPPRRIRFQWIDDADGDTSVEFTIEPHDTGVTLSVVERGLAAVGGGLKRRREHYAENYDGWGDELRAAEAWCLAR